MNQLRGITAWVAVLMLLVCAKSHAQQVLDEVPSDAVGVFEVKDLHALSGKVAKLVEAMGLDQLDPRFADPLATLQDELGVKEGLSQSGGMAMAFFNPDKAAKGAHKAAGADADGAADEKGGDAGDKAPPMIVLLPVDDYKAFLGNFKDVKSVGGGVSQVTVAKDNETLFVVQRGKYAASAMDKSLLAKKGGFKLAGAASKEAGAKDALLYFNLAMMRPEIQKGMKQGREMLDQQANGGGNAAAANPLATPQMKTLVDQYFKAINQFVTDTRSAAISFNLDDAGIGTAMLADFEPDSHLGKMMAQVQNTNESLITGLPQGKYFAFGGAKITPEVATQLLSDFLDPLQKQLKGEEKAQDVSAAFDALKQAVGSMKSVSFGYVAPAGGAGAGESLIQAVSVAHGDAKSILKAQKTMLPLMNSLMGLGDKKSTAELKFDETKSVAGVELQTYTMKLNFDPGDPQGAQAQQMLSMLYGRNGMTGAMGVVDPNTFIAIQGGGDKLIADAVTAAKGNAHPLDQVAKVKGVAGHLPTQRALEYYVAMDNIISTGVNFAKQQGIAVPFKLPPNLSPIGVSAGTDASAVRMDSYLPIDLIQAVTSAGMQAWMQMNGAGGAGGPGGQGGGI